MSAEGLEADLARDADGPLLQERQRHATFVSTLAHELRQPLSALSQAVDLMRLVSGSPSASLAAEIIQRQTRRMTRLVEDLMDSARCAQGKMTLRLQRVDVRQVVADAALDATAAVAARGQQFEVSIAPTPLWVDADPERLQQVLSNLLDNAVKYTAPGGRIHLAAGRANAAITVRVSDTGRGLEPRALAHIFDMFSQVRPDEGAGLGLGLSIALEIVTRHRGRIEARSEGHGLGSEFIVTLPMATIVGINR
ncbi:MAG TPA: HAMP domain-containing sensor histidine kinase [Vicinamibacterales bacterium]|nr:HAMP domain-containing sensor histidine kinase [Vicinamibacterales bacterium]